MATPDIGLIARNTGLTVEAAQRLLNSGGIRIRGYEPGGDNSPGFLDWVATSPAAAAEIVDAGGFNPDPSQTGTNDPTVNRTVAIARTMGLGYDDIVDGDALARYGITDPGQVAQIQGAFRSLQEWQNQNLTANRRAQQQASLFGATTVLGGGLGAEFLSTGAATGATDLGLTYGMDYGLPNLTGLGSTATAFPVVDTAAGITSNALGLAEGAATASTASALAPVVEGVITPVTQGLTVQQAISAITTGVSRVLGGGTGGGGLLGNASTLLTGGLLTIAGLRAGGGTAAQTQTTTAPPMTPEERELLTLTINRIKADDALYAQLAPFYQAQIDELMRTLGRSRAQEPDVIRNFVNANMKNPQAIRDAMLTYGVSATRVGDVMGYTPQQVSDYTGVPLSAAERAALRQEEIETIQLETLRQGGRATKEQARDIQTVFFGEGEERTGGLYGAGLAEIDRFRTETARAITEEVAAARGLSPSDTPILNLLGTAGDSPGLAGEVTRQQGILLNNMISGEAAARLNYPLAASQAQSAVASSAGSLNLAGQNFRAQLAESAAANRYRLLSNPYQLPQSSNAAGNLALNLGNQRLSQSTVSTSGSRGLGMSDYARLAGGVGSLMYGTNRLF